MAPHKLRRGSGVSFDAGTTGAVRANVWDRWTSWGAKTKDGSTTVFDETTLSQAVENFRRQANDLYMDYDHQSAYVADNGKPAIALAWYCALAVIRGGQVLAFASHRDGIPSPNATGLDDGLYAYRCEVTDAGQQLLGGGKYRYLSPMFDPDGFDEQGNSVGYLFYCVAATNNPFQDGVEITFEKRSPSATRKKKMTKMDDSGLYKRLGLDEDSTPEQAMAAMRGYMQKHDEVEAAKKLADDDGDGTDDDDAKKKMDGDGDDTTMTDDDAAMKKLADDEAMKKMGDDDEAMKKMAKALGCEPKMSTIAEAVQILKLSHAPKTELAKLAKEVSALHAKLAKQDEEKKRDEAVKFARASIDNGQWNPEEAAKLIEARVENPKLAEAALAPKGTWTVLKRFTKNGEPLGKDRTASEDFSKSDDVEDAGSDYGTKVSEVAKKYAAENKVSFADALNHIASTQPQLYSRSIRR